MKFRKKSHKMCVIKVTNPNNLYRICGCDDDVKYFDRAVACRMKANISGSMSDSIVKIKCEGFSNQKDYRRIFEDTKKKIAEIKNTK